MSSDYPRFEPVPLELPADPLPLTRWDDGSVRVSGSRVKLEFLVHLFQRGASPEEVHAAVPTIELDDIRAVRAFYLRQKDSVDAYVAEVDRQSRSIQRHVESWPGYQDDAARLQQRIEEWKERQRASASHR